MMIIVILIYILGFRSYTHNNYLFFSFKVYAHVSRIFQVSVKCCRTIDNKQCTRLRKAISQAERFCLTLHYLAYGGSQQSLSFSFRIAKSTIRSIMNKTCSPIWDCLKEQYVRPPRTTDDWENIAKDFYEIGNLPHCIGAIDGKHVRIKAPINSGSLYYSYEGFFSIVLMGICDARYAFHSLIQETTD